MNLCVLILLICIIIMIGVGIGEKIIFNSLILNFGYTQRKNVGTHVHNCLIKTSPIELIIFIGIRHKYPLKR